MAYRGLDLANYVVHYALANGKNITHLQLQKILYYIESYMLVSKKKPLLDSDIELWKLGPVVPEVYHEYKIFGSKRISHIPKELKINEGKVFDVELIEFDPESITDEIKEEVNPIVDKLLGFNGLELVNETHKHELWSRFRQRIYQGERGLKYDKAEMRRYFEKNPEQLRIVSK